MVEMLVLALTWVGLFCWIVCFWWMHRISSRQNAVLEELHQVTRRIEQVARSEHELIQDVHPQVNQIKERVETVAQAVISDEEKTKH
jgi:hypothetical protein